MLDTTNPVLLALNRIHQESTWTDQREGDLRKYWEEGLSAGEIAAKLGCGISRSAILGKAHRLGLHKEFPRPSTSHVIHMLSSSTPEEREEVFRQRRERKNAQRRARRAGNAPAGSEPVVLAIEEPVSEPCSLLELTDERCRWPVGDIGESDFHFCGATKPDDGRPYCGSHSLIARASPKPKRDDSGSGSFVMKRWGGK